MKVRIKTAPREREVDGVNLGRLEPGTVREVSPAIASWLIVEGYAEVEMRRQPEPDDFSAWPRNRQPRGQGHHHNGSERRRTTDE